MSQNHSKSSNLSLLRPSKMQNDLTPPFSSVLPNPSLELSQPVFLLLRDLIHEKTGLFFQEKDRETLAWKLLPRLRELRLPSFYDYYLYLTNQPEEEAEWFTLMDLLSVPETYFWREPQHFEALTDFILPQLIQRPRSGPIRIWSAACCTGEEPISILIAMAEKGWIDRIPFQLVATDASPTAIQKARIGLYRRKSFRRMPPHLHEKYFEPAGKDQWRVRPDLLQQIEYQVANLIGPQTDTLAQADVIFCRNVFLYFSQEAIRKTVERFYRAMPSPAYLFVGVCESLLSLCPPFRFEQIGEAFVYVKPEK